MRDVVVVEREIFQLGQRARNDRAYDGVCSGVSDLVSIKPNRVCNVGRAPSPITPVHVNAGGIDSGQAREKVAAQRVCETTCRTLNSIYEMI